MATQFIKRIIANPSVYEQKLNYIHNNPVKAGLCVLPEDYKYSSAGYYTQHEKNWDFLVNEDD